MKKETRTFRTPEGKDMACIYMNLFGVRVWFKPRDFKRFTRVCILTARIERRAKLMTSQLLRLKELTDEFVDTPAD